MKHIIRRFFDRKSYERLLAFKDSDKKVFFDVEDCCGLEIEFAVTYERRSRTYIKTGLTKLKELVAGKGKFVKDNSIGAFLNVEIVLNPFPLNELKPLFEDICSIINFYDNFEFTDNCGVHANFRADEELKKCFFEVLVNDKYKNKTLLHSKYKKDFMQLAVNGDGSFKNYEEYREFQNKIGDKYCSVNFLKENLIEVRSLSLSWEDVEFFYDVYVEAKKLKKSLQ